MNITRKRLIELLNGDLAREYQAIIAYVVYSQVIKGAQYMSIASELEKHAGEELRHALIISSRSTTSAAPRRYSPSRSSWPRSPRRFSVSTCRTRIDTIREYRERVRQCEALNEFAMAEHIREILKDEQEHAIDLATALGEDVPKI